MCLRLKLCTHQRVFGLNCLKRANSLYPNAHARKKYGEKRIKGIPKIYFIQQPRQGYCCSVTKCIGSGGLLGGWERVRATRGSSQRRNLQYYSTPSHPTGSTYLNLLTYLPFKNNFGSFLARSQKTLGYLTVLVFQKLFWQTFKPLGLFALKLLKSEMLM